MNKEERLEKETVNLIFKETNEPLFEITNLSPKRTGLSVIIWSEQQGFTRNKPDNTSRFKIQGKNYELSYSLEEKPQLLAKSGKIKQSDKKDIKEALQYVSKNLDLFLKHFNSTPYEFDDDDLKDELRKRGEYK